MAGYLTLQSLQKEKKIEKNFYTMQHHINNKNPPCGNKKMFIGGPLEESETNVLHDLVINHCPKGDIVEIGSWLGLSTVVLGLSLKERYGNPCYKVHAIDPQVDRSSDPLLTAQQNVRPLQAFKDHGRDHPEVFLPATKDGWTWYDVFVDNINKWEVDEYIEKYREYSFVLDLKSTNIKDLAMLWIDGDHEPDAVLQDLRKYVPLIVDGGFIVMHDMDLVGGPPKALSFYREMTDAVLVDYEERLNLKSSLPKMGIFKKEL